MVGFDGLEASPDVKRLIRDFGVGHVILFARNVDSPEQVAELVRELQEWRATPATTLPLLIAVDQEGGRVARMGPPWTVWPPLRALGRIGSEDLARRMGAALAAELSACGIQLRLRARSWTWTRTRTTRSSATARSATTRSWWAGWARP